MCGIAGFANISRSPFTVDDTLLDAMQQTIAHRGPQGFRIWKSDRHGVGLAHRRLSIIDLSDAAFQPMFDEEKTVVISFNGEIYNHSELRAELEALGYRYSTNSDTETIIHGYKEWGIGVLDRLEGMFAFALFDLRSSELYLVRDRIGIKPLYFSLQGGVLSFASEIKALWPLPWMSKDINSTALSHYLTFMVTPAPMTLYKGVYKLPAAHYLRVDAQRNITFHEWYNPLDAKTVTATAREFEDEQFCIDGIRSLLRASIKKHMISDVPYGVFLSGGIDSSLNVALMAELTDKVKTFNVSCNDGPEYSEVEWARKVAKRYNTEHHEIVISEKEAFDFIQMMMHHHDEPLGDCVSVPLYYVAKLLKDSGATVVQVGEGSDELFCGYTLYGNYLDLHRYWRPTQRLVPAFAKQGMYHAAARLFPHKNYHLELLNNWATDKHLFWSGATAFGSAMKQQVLYSHEADFDPVVEQIYPGFDQGNASYAVVDYHLKQLYKRKPDADFLTSMIYLELKHRLPELLLMRVDKMAMATSVEGRVPFLDHTLVEFALQIPAHLKYKNGMTKYILKKACEGILPEDVIYRKKIGFAAPITRWFKQGSYFPAYFKQLTSQRALHDYLNYDAITALQQQHETSKHDFAVQLWVLQQVMGMETV